MTSGWVNGGFPFQAGGHGNPLPSEPDCSASERLVWLSGIWTCSRGGEGRQGLRSPQGTLLEGLWPLQTVGKSKALQDHVRLYDDLYDIILCPRND